MKIQKFNVPAINPYKANELKAEQSKQKTQLKADKIEISSEAKQLSELSSYSVERNERIQEIKAQVDSGNYKIDAEKLAENLIKYYKP
jgi:negative regulator of flagellin synthesis FlgM